MGRRCSHKMGCSRTHSGYNPGLSARNKMPLRRTCTDSVIALLVPHVQRKYPYYWQSSSGKVTPAIHHLDVQLREDIHA